MKRETMTKRFYATSSAINRPQILMLLPEAIEHAQSMMTKNDVDEYYIVEVVRVVRRIPVVDPIEVIEIRK